jgi:hypothetical protein
MTTQTAVLAAPTGLTLTAKLFTLAAPDTVYKTADSVTYRTNATAQAVAAFTGVAAGDYTMIYFSGTRPVAIGYRTFAGTDGETATETPPTVELDSDAFDIMLQKLGIVRVGTAQAGASGTITLDAGADATTSRYLGCRVSIYSGTGFGQAGRIITAYNGSTKVATVTPNWTINPDNTSVFAIQQDSGTNPFAWRNTAPGNVDSNGYLPANLAAINGNTGRVGTFAGWIDATSVPTDLSSVLTAIGNLNNLSALINIYGSPLLEIPDTGSTLFAFTVVVRDNEGKLVNLDAAPTIAAANAAGDSRSGNLSSVSNPSTGRYTFTYSVANSAAAESLRITCSGTVSAEARYIEWIGAVVDYDTLTTLNAINTKLGTPVTSVSADIAAVSTKLGSPAGASVSADIASIKTDTGTTIPGLFTTLTTKIRKFFQLALRKDAAIATDNATELTELNASGGSGAGAYSNITDAQEAIRDRGDAAWTTGGGGGGGGESLMLSTTIATVTSQTVLILTAGTGENDAYNDMLVVITDSDTSTQKARAIVSDYVGASKTLTLAAAPSFTVAAGDTIAIIAVSGRTTEFTGSALSKLNQVQASVVMQEGATAFSSVRPGGKLVLKGGDDYADDIVTTIILPVTDADEVVYDRLTDATTSAIKFAAGRNRQKNLIVGTVTKADVTKAAGVTYVPIQIARAQLVASTDPTTNRVFNDYKYDIQVTTSGGKVTTPVGGELEVEFDNAD